MWNGSSWNALGGPFSGYVTNLASCNAGGTPRLYAGGEFTAIGPVVALKLACWDGVTWSNFGASLPPGTTIKGLTAWDDGSGRSLYVGANSFAIAGQGYFARVGMEAPGARCLSRPCPPPYKC